MNRIKKFIFEHRIFITVLLLVFWALCLCIPRFFISKGIESKVDLEGAYYLSQIVTSLFVVTGVIIAGWQYYITSKAELSKIEVDQVQRAIELSEFYKDKILKFYNAIYYVYDSIGLISIIDEKNQDDMKIFDTTELKRIIGEPVIKQLKELQTSEEFVKAVLEANDIFNLKLRILHKARQSINESGRLKTIQIEVNPQSVMHSFMSSIVINMLNDMEYFAMHFTHKTADETVVFQSLHQTYLKIIKHLYYNIAKSNEPCEGKYYTNVIELYNIWYKRSKEIQEQMIDNTKQITRKGTIINKNK